MKSTTRAIAVAVGLTMLLALPAVAQQGDEFVGYGTATGFELTIDDNGLVVGRTRAAVQSAAHADGCGEDSGDVRACASGLGEINIGDTHAEALAQPGQRNAEEGVGFALPEDFHPLLSADFGAGSAEAESNGTASALGEAAAAEISINVTQTLFEEAGALQDGLQEISDTLLGPIAEGDPSGVTARVKDSLDLLIENLDEAPLATISVGPSLSESTDDGDLLSVRALARGSRIVIAPFPDPVGAIPDELEGLIIIEVGSASVTLTSDRQAASAEADPAIVRVRIFNPETADYDDIPLGPGPEALVIAEDTPLQSTIFPAGTAIEEDGATASARSAAVAIQLFDGEDSPLPQVNLRLAYAEGGVASAAAPPPPPPAPEEPAEPQPAPDLPRTGADAVLPGLAMLALGGAGFYGSRRLRR